MASDSVFGGTLVVAGNGIAEVTATGLASEAGPIGALLYQLDDTPTRLQRDTARLVRMLGALTALISLGLFVLSVARGSAWIDALLSAIALAMALRSARAWCAVRWTRKITRTQRPRPLA